MSIRRFSGYIFFLLTTVCASAQTSTWWYPLGNAEGTRHNSAPTESQDTSDLIIKWRNDMLKNAPTVLVGAVSRTPSETPTQQVVGINPDANTLTVLSHNGTQRLHLDYDTVSPPYFSNDFSLTLTGLFDSAAAAPAAGTIPNLIGVGVTRVQPGENQLWGFLADSTGRPSFGLSIPLLPESWPETNREAGIFPIAVMKLNEEEGPFALATVSQNRFNYVNSGPGSPTPVNSLRKYSLRSFGYPSLTDSLWTYFTAPKPGPHPPSVSSKLDLVNPPSTGVYTGLPTSTYGTVFERPSGHAGQPTRSTYQYGLTINAYFATSAPRQYDVLRMPPPLAGTRPDDSLGEAHTYFVELTPNAESPAESFRVVVENHSAQRPGIPILVLRQGNDQSDPPVLRGLFQDSAMENRGWAIATADLDGIAPGHQNPNLKLPNNTGNEIIGAWDPPADMNWLYVFRYNTAVPSDQGNPFTVLTRQRLMGSWRLMASGDLVADTDERDEVVIAANDTVAILQLRDYNDPLFIQGDINTRQPFKTLKKFGFGSRVVSVAIADLEGDGENDLIVCTEAATYAVGKAPAKPFGTPAVTSGTFCTRDLVKLFWNRRVAGSGIAVTLEGNEQSWAIAPPENPSPFGPDSVVFSLDSLDGLEEGSYRLFVRDPALPVLKDSTEAFTILEPGINGLTLADPKSLYQVGDEVELSTSIRCVDSLRLEFSIDGSSWTPFPDTEVEISGAAATAELTLSCFEEMLCGIDQTVNLRLRLADIDGPAVSAEQLLPLRLPLYPLTVTPDGDTVTVRMRTVTWPADSFTCTELTLYYSLDETEGWQEYGTVDAADGRLLFQVEDAVTGRIRLCLRCSGESGCERGTGEFRIPEVELNGENFVYPNPFRPAVHFTANIAYQLKEAGSVSITIYDASRSVVRRLIDDTEQNAGEIQTIPWDGKNSRGEIVADGTYICIIESDSGERIILPIIVAKR